MRIPALALALLCACSTSAAVDPAASGFRSLQRGVNSAIDSPGVRVARDAAQWRALWQEHARRQVPPPPAPELDLAASMAIHVALGPRPTAGYALAVERVALEHGVLVIEARETRPEPGAITAQVETSPFEIVLVPQSDAHVELRLVP